MQISPSGDHIAFLREMDGKRDLTVSELATGKATAIALHYEIPQGLITDLMGKPEPRDFRWLSSTRLQIGANSSVSLGSLLYSGQSAFDLDGSKWRDLPGVPANYGLGGQELWWDTQKISPSVKNPGTILVRAKTSPWLYTPFPDLFQINTINGVYTLVAKNPGNIREWVLGSDESPRFGVAQTANSSKLLSYHGEGNSWSEYADLGPDSARCVVLGLNGDETQLYVSRPDLSGRAKIDVFDLREKRWGKTLLKHERYDIVPAAGGFGANFPAAYGEVILSAPVFSASTGDLLGARTVTDGPHQLWLTDRFADLQRRLDESFKGMGNIIVSMNRAEDKMIVLSYSARDPGSYWYAEMGNKRLRPLGRRMPWITPSEMGETYPVRIPTRDGLEIDGYLTLPPGQKGSKLPLAVLFRSSAWQRESWGFDASAQFLATRGYAVLQVNHRGSTGYGASFASEESRDLGGRLHDDITDAVQWTVARGIADPSRIAAVGEDKFGSFCALSALARNPKLYCCGIVQNLVIDWENAVLRTSGARYWNQKLGFTLDKAALARLANFSPKEFGAQISAPLLILHDEYFGGTTLQSAKALASALKSHGHKPETFFYFPTLAQEEQQKNFEDSYRRIETFLASHLKAPEPHSGSTAASANPSLLKAPQASQRP